MKKKKKNLIGETKISQHETFLSRDNANIMQGEDLPEHHLQANQSL